MAPSTLKGNDHIVGAACPKCHHPNYYDKRVICRGEIHYRRLKDGSKADELIVKCQECGEKMTIKADCEGYK